MASFPQASLGAIAGSGGGGEFDGILPVGPTAASVCPSWAPIDLGRTWWAAPRNASEANSYPPLPTDPTMKDPAHALDVVCEELTKLAKFNPVLVDANWNPVPGADQRSVKGLFKQIEDEDKQSPPPGGPRVDTFLRRVDNRIWWEFYMTNDQLINDRFPTVGDIVAQIMD